MRVSTHYIIYIRRREWRMGTDCACCEKGVLLDCKRITFGRQKESFWGAKGVHLEGKRSPFEKRLFLHPKTTGILWG